LAPTFESPVPFQRIEYQSRARSGAGPLSVQETSTRLSWRTSRGTPRKTNNLLRWVRDFAAIKGDGRITTEMSVGAFQMQEIDGLGLESQDRRYLLTLITVFSGGPAGVQALARLNIHPTRSDEVEPFLLRCSFIQRTPRDRMVTASGQHLDPGDDGAAALF
jgi:Holliday junction DNA helicase RuvB